MSVCTPCAKVECQRCDGCGCLHEKIEFRNPPVLYHGGVGGLEPGDRILPASRIGYLRAQECFNKTGYQDDNVDRLWFKDSYRAFRVYGTKSLEKATRHAGQAGEWNVFTGADKVFPPFGSVYRVEAFSDIHPDFYHGSHPLIHPDFDSEAFYFSEDVFYVEEVIIPEVHPGMPARSISYLDGSELGWDQSCRNAYAIWREMMGRDWWELCLLTGDSSKAAVMPDYDNATDGELLIELKRYLAIAESIKAELTKRGTETT